ncbi:cysteine-rich RLK (RECEPTOR-like protein kinase) 14 [Forsythia ovata]|uniref:Cysteine-rich RLK (RECEPTOR-like protein kinase) 14 n=1 Tax=Forsythia ovata TaxID=205694 RepID=A0ABD1R9U9_9LAMI
MVITQVIGTYKTNLDSLLSSVSSNIDINGFYNTSMGENPDRVDAIALCRADLQPYQCRDYIENATAMILKLCPHQKQAILWHEFCMIRYSNESILGTLAYFPYKAGHSMQSVPNQDKFYKELNILLDGLRNQAAYGSSPKKFAAAVRADPDYRTIYAFEQCTPDISPEDCGACLEQSALIIQDCCSGARGVRILRPSCYLRFETDPFYNETMVRILEPVPKPKQPVPVPAPAPPQPRKDNNTTRTVLIITIPNVVCLILALCIIIFLIMKQNHKRSEKLQIGQANDETITVESLNNKRQGRFGAIYKQEVLNGNETAVKGSSIDLDHDDPRVVDANYEERLVKKIKEECMEEFKEMYSQQMKSFEDQLSIMNSQIDFLKSQLSQSESPTNSGVREQDRDRELDIQRDGY